MLVVARLKDDVIRKPGQLRWGLEFISNLSSVIERGDLGWEFSMLMQPCPAGSPITSGKLITSSRISSKVFHSCSSYCSASLRVRASVAEET